MPADHQWVTTDRETRRRARTAVRPDQRGSDAFRQRARRATGHSLRSLTCGAYIALHTRARLGVNDDKRKSRLMRDERLTSALQACPPST